MEFMYNTSCLSTVYDKNNVYQLQPVEFEYHPCLNSRNPAGIAQHSEELITILYERIAPYT